MPKRTLPTSRRRNSSRSHHVTSKSKKRNVKRRSTTRKSDSPWLVTVIGWLLVAAVGLGIAWYLLVWGVAPAVLGGLVKNSTVAIVPSQADGNVLLIHFGNQIKSSKVFIVQGDTIVNLPGKYGEYRLTAVYPLLELEKKDQRYLIGSMNRVTGIFLDEVIKTSKTYPHDVKDIRKAVFEETKLQLKEHKKLNVALLASWYALSHESVVNQDVPLLEVSQLLKREMGGTFAARDECSIAILNSTDISGLAGRLSTIVEDNGGVVVRLGQHSEKLENSQLLYDPSVKECAAALDQIKTLSPVPFEIKEDITVQSQFRAPVVAIIGENFE